MISSYQSLADLLNPKKEEEQLMTPMSQEVLTEDQLMTPMEQAPDQSIMSEMSPEQMSELQAVINTPATTPAPVQQELVPKISSAIKTSEVVEKAKPQMPAPITSIEEAPKAPEVKEPTALQKLEAMMENYRKSDQAALEEARRQDRMLKVGGALGDALATYLNARGQMNVKAPGVQVQQGAGIGKIADMFATSGDIASDVAQRRQALLKQYAELAKGEREQSKLKTQQDLAKEERQFREKMFKSEADLKKELSRLDRQTSLDVAKTKQKEETEFKPSFEEKETIKANIKERLEESKENRKLKKELEPAIANVDEQIKNVKDALKLINKSKIVGTGPLDQYIAGATPEGQLLKKALGNISLDTLVQKFQGMSRAIDTETDRKFFQETQPSMGNFETTNKKMLNDILTRLEGIKARSESKLQEIESQKETQPVTIQKTQETKNSNVQKYADDYFQGDYNKAFKFLKNRGDIK